MQEVLIKEKENLETYQIKMIKEIIEGHTTARNTDYLNTINQEELSEYSETVDYYTK